jgi:hypothetical protein
MLYPGGWSSIRGSAITALFALYNCEVIKHARGKLLLRNPCIDNPSIPAYAAGRALFVCWPDILEEEASAAGAARLSCPKSGHALEKRESTWC